MPYYKTKDNPRSSSKVTLRSNLPQTLLASEKGLCSTMSFRRACKNQKQPSSLFTYLVEGNVCTTTQPYGNKGQTYLRPRELNDRYHDDRLSFRIVFLFSFVKWFGKDTVLHIKMRTYVCFTVSFLN